MDFVVHEEKRKGNGRQESSRVSTTLINDSKDFLKTKIHHDAEGNYDGRQK